MAVELFMISSKHSFLEMSLVTPAQAVQALQNILDGCDVEGIWKHLEG
jgi:hypothetical protein